MLVERLFSRIFQMQGTVLILRGAYPWGRSSLGALILLGRISAGIPQKCDRV